ncbi:MAG: macrolide ABC transporter permease/ATP-binding protein MacB, partial [Planctomycetaceae bacterium]
RALVNNPHVLLADEPTGNLDTATSVEIMDLLDALNRAGRTIVMVTHEPDIAARAKRVVRLRDGRVASITENPRPAGSGGRGTRRRDAFPLSDGRTSAAACR